MDYNKKLQIYLTNICNSIQSSYEWYINEYEKNNDMLSYSSAISCIDSYKDDMQGAIGFAYFADLISEEQFNEAWKLTSSICSAYADKFWDLFYGGK